MKIAFVGSDPNQLDSLPVLKSIQRVFRNLSLALESLGSKVKVMKAWEGEIDFSQIDAIVGTYEALRIRRQLNLDIPTLVIPLGDMPNGGVLLFAYHGLFKPYDCIAFSCSSDLDIFNRLVQEYDLMLKIVPLPVNSDIFYRRSVNRELLKKKYSIPKQGKLLFYAGRISLQKNLHILIKIFEEVVKSKEATLSIAGTTDQTPLAEFGACGDNYIQKLEEIIRNKGLTNKVVFIGSLDDDALAEMYSISDIFVNATVHHDENFGFSQVEAQSCGLPVVASGWGGIKDTVIHGKTGFLMQTILTDGGPRLEWLSGVRYILNLISNDLLWKRMSDKCIMHVLSNFSIKAVSERILGILEEMVSLRKAIKTSVSPSIRIKDEVRSYIINAIKPTELGRLKYHIFPILDSEEAKWFYKTRMEPYSSMALFGLDNINGTEIPYKAIDMNIHKDKGIVELSDLLWHKEMQIDPESLSFLALSNGKKCINEICNEMGILKEDGIKILKKLIRKGLIIFVKE
ncbi:MAG: glycosyltransferase family 4 protein [bacterium]